MKQIQISLAEMLLDSTSDSGAAQTGTNPGLLNDDPSTAYTRGQGMATGTARSY